MEYLGGWVNKDMPKLYFVSLILVLGLLNGAKRAKFKVKWGSKYEIVKFATDNAFEVLQLHKQIACESG